MSLLFVNCTHCYTEILVHINTHVQNSQYNMYFANPKFFRFADLDGNGRQMVHEGRPYAYSIDIFENWIYWTDWHVKQVRNFQYLSFVSC